MIKKEDLEKWVDREVGMLRYYGLRADRERLTPEVESIYDNIRSIGYTKVVIPLHRRCSWTTITSDNPVTKDTTLEEMNQVHTWYRDNKFTPLEIYWMIYPEKRKEIIYILNKGQYE